MVEKGNGIPRISSFTRLHLFSRAMPYEPSESVRGARYANNRAVGNRIKRINC